MERLKFIVIIFLLGVCFSCTEEEDLTKELTQEEEAQNLTQMFLEIQRLATSETCDDSANWTFTSYGSKACGGPIGFIPYSKNIDTVLFLQKVEEHRLAQRAFNEKWEIVSDCALAEEPAGVVCQNGSPVLDYGSE